MALDNELAELRASIKASAPATDEEPGAGSRLAELFKGLESAPTSFETPQTRWLEEMQESRSQFDARMEDLAESVASTRRAEVERDEAMLRALETMAVELERANENEDQAASREHWMLRLTLASVLLAAVAAITGVLTQLSA